MASAIHFPGRRKIEKGGKKLKKEEEECMEGEGKPPILLQMLPTSGKGRAAL